MLIVSGIGKRGLACLAGMMLSLAVPAGAADDYLSILEAEANDTGGQTDSTNVAVPAARSVKKVRSVQDNQTIRPAMGFEEFERELNANFSGTWFLYDKLNGEQRKTVYRAYQDDNRTANVREQIVRLLSTR
ncbi:MAG: hypothetical protein R3F42_09260 [Pseudomonadota bacterium]